MQIPLSVLIEAEAAMSRALDEMPAEKYVDSKYLRMAWARLKIQLEDIPMPKIEVEQAA